MRPGESPGDDDRRLPVGERRIGERLAGHAQSTTKPRRTPVWHAHAEAHVVVGRGDRQRLVLIVTCPIPSCRLPHLHQARVPFMATVRTGPCGGRYMLHALEAEVAA